METRHWPTEIRLSPDKRTLTVAYEGGESFELSAEYLRVMSPSAEVQGHTPEQRRTVGGKRLVAILAIEPIGHYAIKLSFDDMHDTGIFSWDYLHELGRDHDKRWAAYLAELEEKGFSREPKLRPRPS